MFIKSSVEARITMGMYAFGPFRLDAENRTLSLGTADLAVGSKVVETLLALVEREGQVCTAQQLLDRIWPEGFVEPAILAQNIYVLRKLLRHHWDAPVIETVRRRGYRFVAPVKIVDPDSPTATAPIASTPRPVLAKPTRRIARWFALAACVLLAIVSLSSSAGPVQGTTAQLSPQGARLYAIGRYYWTSRTKAGVLKSVEYFEKVIRSDPHNALGYSGLADAFYTIADYHYGTRSAQTYHAWERHNVEKAFALNPNLSEVRVSRAVLLDSVDHNLAAAHKEYVTAIELNPNNAVAHHWFGILLFYEGKTTQARAELETAEQLEPTSPAITRWLAVTNYVMRRYGPAITYYLQALDLKPGDDEAGLMLGLAYEESHSYTAALDTYRRFEAECKCAAPLVMEARTLALMGEYGQARVQLERANSAARKKDIEPLDMAAALIALGERGKALQYLRRATRSDYFAHVWLKLDPRLDAVRSDPRFRSIFARSKATACTLAC